VLHFLIPAVTLFAVLVPGTQDPWQSPLVVALTTVVCLVAIIIALLGERQRGSR
jgi:hypothetical protein